MTKLVLFTRSMCSGCQEIKDYIWHKRRYLYHQVKRYNTSYLDGLVEMAIRGIMHYPTFPILVEEYDEDNIVAIFTTPEAIKDRLDSFPIEEGEFNASWLPR